VLPLFGHKSTSKLHAVLCHAAAELRLRKSLTVADTSLNEQKHKEEKAAYWRTNRQVRAAGRQLLTVSQSRTILAREEAMATAEAAVEGGASVLPATAPMEEDAWDSSSSEDCVAEPVEFEEPEAVAGVQTGVCTPVGLVSEWPELGAVAAALGVPNFTSIHLLSGTHFHAKYEWGAVSCTELIRSMPIYYGSSWYDYVLYRRLGCTERLCGHVRLIVAPVKGPRGGTRLVVERLVPAGGVPGSVFEEAGHERLRLAFDDDTAEWPSLEVVPLSGILRIVQVVPDVEALAPAFGMWPWATRDKLGT